MEGRGRPRGQGELRPDEERIAQRAADIVWENFTLEVGKLTIRSFLYVVGAVVVAALGWLGLHGKLS